MISNRRAVLRTFSLSLVLCIPWIVIHAYNVIVYTGSHIPTSRYTKLMTNLQSMLGNESTVTIDTYSPCRRKYPNDTILVGHSFGGTFALWDANKPNVKGVVLLYSHFNARQKMWYPGVAMESITPPVLTILGTEDERLPFDRAIDDLFEKQEKGLRNKHFLIQRGHHHFSGLVEGGDDKTKGLAKEIAQFIQCMDSYDTAFDERAYDWYQSSAKPTLACTQDLSQSVDMLDAIVKVSGLPGWWHFHFIMFLLSKPTHLQNFEFTWKDSVLYKTYNVPMEKFQAFVDKEMFPNIHIEWRVIRVPSVHPAILTWLLREPRLIPATSRARTSSAKWKGELIMLPVNENVTYYRIPHRHWLLSNVSNGPSPLLDG